jgi:hypothetical protein
MTRKSDSSLFLRFILFCFFSFVCFQNTIFFKNISKKKEACQASPIVLILFWISSYSVHLLRYLAHSASAC